MPEKNLTHEEVMKMFPVMVECGSSDICNNFKMNKCKTCLRNKYHICLKDNYQIKKHILKDGLK